MWAKVFSAFIASFILIDFSVPSIILEYILICWNEMGCSFYICQFCAHWWKKEVIYGFCLKTNLTKEIIRKAFCFTCKNWKRCQIFDHLQVHLLYFCNCVWPFLCFLNFSKSLFLSFLDHLVKTVPKKMRHMKKVSINKNSTIFVQLSWNLVKR